MLTQEMSLLSLDCYILRLMWIAGILAALSSIIYPAISALVSKNANAEQQGVVLGILTGMRGLCNGLGPALFGLLFWMFNVNLSDNTLEIGQTEGLGDMSAADAVATRFHNASFPHAVTMEVSVFV